LVLYTPFPSWFRDYRSAAGVRNLVMDGVQRRAPPRNIPGLRQAIQQAMIEERRACPSLQQQPIQKIALYTA
jgi:hypothetical protein